MSQDHLGLISIVTVHNGDTGRVLQLIRGYFSSETPRPPVADGLDPIIEWIVVDNNPELGMGIQLRAEFREVRYLPKARNNGTAGAINVGLKMANGEFVFITNPETIITPVVLKGLLIAMTDNEAVIPMALHPTSIVLPEKISLAFPQEKTTDAVNLYYPGIMIRKELLIRLDGCDENGREEEMIRPLVVKLIENGVKIKQAVGVGVIHYYHPKPRFGKLIRESWPGPRSERWWRKIFRI